MEPRAFCSVTTTTTSSSTSRRISSVDEKLFDSHNGFFSMKLIR